jgi:glutaminyl-tRNA synthetase
MALFPALTKAQDFRTKVAGDIANGRFDGRVVTRWPPEPNGYLHIGHATAINLDSSLAAEFGGHCNLRFDDTNPTKEKVEYVEAIKEDTRWLGFDWGEHLYFASDFGETKNRSGLNQNG